MLSSPQLDELNLRLSVYRSEYAAGESRWALRCCELALQSLCQGNYGVGAVLLDSAGNCLAEAGNQVFSQGYHSAAHAEMRVLDQFESDYPDYADRSRLTLLVSLEPCPMCCCRILASGIGQIRFLAKDKNGAMMSRCDKLPPAWGNLAELADISVFNGFSELNALAGDIAIAHEAELRKKLISIIRPKA